MAQTTGTRHGERRIFKGSDWCHRLSLFIGSPIVSGRTGIPIIPVSAAITDASGRLCGVISMPADPFCPAAQCFRC